MQQRKYKYLFFDLDRTLWDFEKNMHDTMLFLFNKYLKNKINKAFEEFIRVFDQTHENLWKQYREGNLKKDQLRNLRFFLTLKQLRINDRDLSKKLNSEYLFICPRKTNLIPYTLEILEYLYSKYSLYVVTNGFIETQNNKLNACNLNKYFIKIFSSEIIGFNKPDPRIFAYAVNSLNAKKSECIMIGDDISTDITGAKNYGIDQVFFNPNNIETEINPTFTISSLKELITIL